MIVEGEMIILTSGCQALALFERQLCYEMPSPHATLSGLAWSGLEVEEGRLGSEYRIMHDKFVCHCGIIISAGPS